MKKIVGISGNQKERDGFIRDCVFIENANSIKKVGGIPIILPMTEIENVIKGYIDTIDALLLSGGNDVDPRNYGEERKAVLGKTNRNRDKFDLLLIKYALEKKIPIMGICRGMQILNVYFGGTLCQDIWKYKKAELKHHEVNNYWEGVHKVFLEKNSQLEKLLGPEPWVNSIHHQSVEKIGKDLKVVGRSSDGIIEAYEHENPEVKVYGIQWHPELMFGVETPEKEGKEMKKLFKLLVED